MGGSGGGGVSLPTVDRSFVVDLHSHLVQKREK